MANETRTERKTEVRWEIRDNTAAVLESGKENVTVKALSQAWLPKIERPELDIFTQYLSYALYEDGDLVQESTVIFSVPKFFRYQDPKLSCTVDGGAITVKAESYAKCVEIRNGAEDLILSDNYFDMNAGEKTVRILSGKPAGLKLRSVYDIK